MRYVTLIHLLVAGVLGIAALPPAANADEPTLTPFEVTGLAPGVFVHYGIIADRTRENLGDNANIGFIVGTRCVLAVDTGGSLSVGHALREAIRKVTPLPVCYVVLTHVHPDHFFGAAAFLDDHPQFIAHDNYPAQLAARATFLFEFPATRPRSDRRWIDDRPPN